MSKIRRIATCFLGVVMIFLVAGCTKNDSIKQTSRLGAGTAKEQVNGLQVVAVVNNIDTVNKTITLFDVDSQMQQTVEYNGGTQVYNRSGGAILISQISCGEIVQATFGKSDRCLEKVEIYKDAWEYKKIKNLDIDRTKGEITVTGRKYQYDKNVAVFYEDQAMMLIDLNDRDELTIKGIGTKAYSFTVTKGHGYIRLGGHEEFIDGNITVDKNIFLKIQQNMLITVAEGEHTVVIEKDDMQIIENIIVGKDQEFFLDLSEYEMTKKNEGRVKFVITPSEAVLYVNGKARNHNRILSLPYGTYAITVRADGYKDYTGVLKVQESTEDYETIYVDLVEDSGSTVGAVTPTTKASTTPTDATMEPAATLTPTPGVTPSATPKTSDVDIEHKITVKGPEGAKVYVDGQYKGEAPLSFNKIVGDIDITLSKEGYVTKSYSLTIEDDEEDIEFTFAELVKEN